MLNQSTTKLTVELGELIENGFELFNFDYPSFYKGAEKLAFEQKIIDHYYFRQIGQETPQRFRHYLKCKLREIMPYYIQRYESVALMAEGIKSGEINPLENYSMVEEGTNSESANAKRTGSGTTSMTGSGEVTNTKNGTQKFSDTPQNNLSNLDNYLTNATVNDENEHSQSSETKNGTQSETNTEESTGNGSHTLTRHGNIGVTTYAQMLEGYRQTFINVDMEIIEELNCLFLGVY